MARNLEELAKNTKVSIETIGPEPRKLDMKEMLRILKSKYNVERFLALGGPGFSTELIMQDCVDNYYINESATLSGNQNIRSYFSHETGFEAPTDLELVSLKMLSDSPDEEGRFTLYKHFIPKR